MSILHPYDEVVEFGYSKQYVENLKKKQQNKIDYEGIYKKIRQEAQFNVLLKLISNGNIKISLDQVQKIIDKEKELAARDYKYNIKKAEKKFSSAQKHRTFNLQNLLEQIKKEKQTNGKKI